MPNEIWIVTDEQQKLDRLIKTSNYPLKRLLKANLSKTLEKQNHFQLPLIILIDCNYQDCIKIARDALEQRNKLKWFGAIRSPIIEFLKEDGIEHKKEKEILDFINTIPDTPHIRTWSDLETPAILGAMMETARVKKLSFVIGKSPAFVSALNIAERFAPTDLPVLIKGKSGTGKELISFYIHLNSQRSEEKYFPLNCGSFNDNLVNSELFGHEKGIFTDAKETKEGILEATDKGTLFLDQIESLSPTGQKNLLRFLENDGEFRKMGGTKILRSDVRVIAATNINLETLIKEGNFREDLYYRLNVFSINLPELKDRGSDVLLLTEHFLRELSLKNGRVKNIDQEVKDALQKSQWRGNVRQLSNVLKYAFVYCKGDTIGLDDLPSDFTREILTGRSVQDNKDEDSKTKTPDQPLRQMSPAARDENLWEELNPTKRNTITKDANDIEIIKKAFLKGHGSPHKAAKLLKEAGFKKNISNGAIRNMLGDSNSEKAVVPDLRSWYINNFNTNLAIRLRKKLNMTPSL